MSIADLNGRTICILGYGREGHAMVEALEKYAPDAEITIADKNPNTKIQNPKHWKQLGEGWLENLDKFDVIIKSPGIPPSSKRKAQSAKLTSSTQIFLDLALSSGALVIGVTGSKGKSTTASLIHAILRSQSEEADSQVFLVGNIGEPAIAHLADVHADTIFILEMSSYQLADLRSAPHIAVITSIFPEHLDYHGSLKAYIEAKANITTLQKEGDIVFYADTEDVRPLIRTTKAETIPVRAEDSPVAIGETALIGDHNLSNIALAAAVARHLGVPESIVISAIREFTPLPHRLQSLGIRDGIEWIDDAISTTPESAIAALGALGDHVKVIILGGQDRGNDFAELGRIIDASAIDTVILHGESGNRIGECIAKKVVVRAKTMADVVRLAAESVHSTPNPNPNPPTPPIILLSPASPSYDMYANFEEKGRNFKNFIEKLS